MRTIERRLKALEVSRDNAARLLPTIIVVPADSPDRAAVLADVQRLRRRGLTVIEIADDAERLAAMTAWLGGL